MDGFTESPLFSPHEHSLRPSDAAEAFRRKRKAQGQRACFPCRQRKVRCSFETPCQTCFTRNHPELCTYDPPLKRIHIDPTAARAADGPEISGPAQSESDLIHTKLETLEGSLLDIQESIAQLSDVIGHLARDRNNQHAPALDATANAPSEAGAQAEGIYINPDMTGENVYLGPQSVPAMVMALGKGEDGGKIQEVLGTSVLPVFGLDNETATYPFVDLWGLPHGSPMRIRELCATLPSDADCLEYFRYYRDTAHVLFPVIVDIEHFESNLTNFLIIRDNNGLEVTGDELAKQEVYGKDLHWLGLLFAILASGCQCSGLSRKERQLTSQVYVCCSYECLRIINYLSHSTPIDIQNLLILGNVISNSMNAGVAWSLLGLTIRLAQSLGLHRAAPDSAAPAVKLQRSNIWWQIIWQDSLLSISYDRASPTVIIDALQGTWLLGQTKMSYADCMRSLCILGLDIVQLRAAYRDSSRQVLQIMEYRDKIRDLLDRSSSHLQDLRMCRSMKDHLEYWNFFLHRSYVMAELCRPVINTTNPNEDVPSSLKQICIDSLADTVEAFLGLQKITKFAVYSWAALHRALSSALLLGLLGMRTKNERARRLLDKLVTVMSNVLSGLEPVDLPGPIIRSVEALRKLIPHQGPRDLPLVQAVEEKLDTDDSGIGSSSSESSTPFFLRGNEGSSPHSIVQSIIWGKGYGA